MHVKQHTDEGPFSCTTCGLTFPFLGELKIHMKSHKGEQELDSDMPEESSTDAHVEKEMEPDDEPEQPVETLVVFPDVLKTETDDPPVRIKEEIFVESIMMDASDGESSP